MLAEDLDKLESLSGRFLREKSRTSSGLWKLTIFYAGIYAACSDVAKDNEQAWTSLEQHAQAWAEKYPQSPSAHISVSVVSMCHAWAIRGRGYANTVPPEAWEGFHRYIALTRDNLMVHKAVASVDPAWYQEMLFVAAHQGWPRSEFDSLLTEALQREPYYYQTYFAAMAYLLPKWHGSIDDIERFANDAVERTKQDEGRSMYARIYWSVSQGQFRGRLFQESRADWPKMKAGFDDILARYPDRWNINNYAWFACLAGDRATTKALLPRVGETPLEEVWKPAASFGRCRMWATEG